MQRLHDASWNVRAARPNEIPSRDPSRALGFLVKKEENISSRRLVEIGRETSLNDIVNRASHPDVSVRTPRASAVFKHRDERFSSDQSDNVRA